MKCHYGRTTWGFWTWRQRVLLAGTLVCFLWAAPNNSIDAAFIGPQALEQAADEIGDTSFCAGLPGVSSAGLETMGEAALTSEVTYGLACQRALTRARLKAVEQACGVSVQGAVLVSNAVFAGAYLASQSEGFIVRERVLGWRFNPYPQKAPHTPPMVGVAVRLKSCVFCQKEGRDAGFDLDARLNRPVYLAGEKLTIAVRANRSCYVYFFNLMADNKVRIFPPSLNNVANRLETGTVLRFPGEFGGIEVVPFQGHSVDQEAYLVLATKKPVDFTWRFKEGEDIKDIGLTDFFKALVSIPIDQRQEKILVYEVRARK